MARITRFGDFWLYYLQEHARPSTRALHYLGTSLAVGIMAMMLCQGHWYLTLGLPVAGYGFAWIGHFWCERNRPATFRYPLWSLSADFLMWYRFIVGHMAGDLRRAGVGPDGRVDPARRIAG